MKTFAAAGAQLPLAASPKALEGMADTAHPVILAPSPRRPAQPARWLSHAPEDEEEEEEEKVTEDVDAPNVAPPAFPSRPSLSNLRPPPAAPAPSSAILPTLPSLSSRPRSAVIHEEPPSYSSDEEEEEEDNDNDSSVDSSDSLNTPQSPSPLLLDSDYRKVLEQRHQYQSNMQAFLQRVAKSHGYHPTPSRGRTPGWVTPAQRPASAAAAVASSKVANLASAAAAVAAQSQSQIVDEQGQVKQKRMASVGEATRVASLVGLSLVLYVLLN
jgi:hypothetical protein